jgi:ATP-dependent DNA ligase
MLDLRRPGLAAEEKWDGTRVKVEKKNDKVTLINRNGINYTHRLTEIVDAAEQIKGNFVIDTEAVYINPDTKEVEFTPCQRRCSTQDWVKQYLLRQEFPITGEAFDIMELYGLDVTHQPYLARKKLLFELLEDSPAEIQYTPYTFELEKAWEDVKRRGSEGLVLKDINSPYVFYRSFSWLKLKNWKFQRVHVVGYTPGQGARSPFFGSLVLEIDEVFVGCAGSGFNEWELIQTNNIIKDAPEMSKPFEIGEPYTAIKTSLEIEVKYYKRTEANNVMRWPIFSKIFT